VTKQPGKWRAGRIREAVREGFEHGYREWPDPSWIEGPAPWWLKAYRHGHRMGMRLWRQRHG
jgi:hypothetical protein